MKIKTTEELLKYTRTGKINVTDIILPQKDLQHVPDLTELKNLKLLDLSCNRLTQLKFLSTNKALETLLVYDNQLKELNDIANLRNLKILHTQYNQVQQIDSCFLNLSNLTEIRLDANQIEEISSEAFSKCTSLTNLDLSYNQLENVEFVLTIPKLTYVSLNHNKIRSIAPLAQCDALLDADVSDNLITDHGMGLEGYPVIQRLNLANNEIQKLGDLDPIRNLTSLNVSNNRLEKTPKFHVCFPNLETLELTGNPLHVNEELFEDLGKCEMLRELTVDDNMESGCGEEASKLLEFVSKHAPQLVRVNNTNVKKQSSRKVDGMAQCHEHQRQVYDLIESQLSNLTRMTAPLEASLNKSFDTVHELLARVDEELEKRSDRALSESLNVARSGVKNKLHDALNFAASGDKGDGTLMQHELK